MLVLGAVNQTYGFFTRRPVIGGESISLRASAVINQTAVFFTVQAATVRRRTSRRLTPGRDAGPPLGRCRR